MNFRPEIEQDETGIELTPLIDVVFLLLIFFMISTTFTKETALKINLPQSQGEATENQPFRVEVIVSAQSEYAISTSDSAVEQTLVNSNRDTLVSALQEFQAREMVLVVIRADKNATHQAVIKVLDVARELGMTNISFAAERNLQ